MPKYVVEVKEVHSSLCEIESDEPMDRSELLEKAQQMIEAGEQSDYLEYDRTMEPDSWTTREEGGDFVT